MKGTTLLELLAALVIMGIVAGLAVPGATRFRDRLLVEHHTHAVITAYQRARLAALLGSARSVLHIEPDRLDVYVLHGSDSVLVWQAPGPASDGVALTGPARTAFAPAGITMGLANGTYVLVRGGVSRTVVASRLGRLRVTSPRRVRRRRPVAR